MWQRALRYLGSVGWDAEDIERACEAVSPLCQDEDTREVSPSDVLRELGGQISRRAAEAILDLARVHDQADAQGAALRAALRDFERFVNGENG